MKKNLGVQSMTMLQKVIRMLDSVLEVDLSLSPVMKVNTGSYWYRTYPGP